jgi:uncharacterized protein YdeI (YjbR/CyaY-like superfamily)
MIGVMAVTEREQVHLETREAWRHWLAVHHGDSPGVWLVSWKKHTGRPAIGYAPSVEEALCFGWVDSQGRAIDADRSALQFTPRNPRSRWSRPNKQRVERLLAAGLMMPAGLAVIEQAKANGGWTALDDVEDLVVPPDLAAAFAQHPPGRGRVGGVPALGAARHPRVDRRRAPARDARPAHRRHRREGGAGRARQPVAAEGLRA